MGTSMESRTDREPAADRLPRRHLHAHQPRSDLPSTVRAGPRCTSSRVDRLPAHGKSAARTPAARTGARQVLRDAGHPHQRAACVGVGSGCAWSLRGRPHPGARQLGDRHAGGADDAIHDAAASATSTGSWLAATRQTRPSTHRSWPAPGIGGRFWRRIVSCAGSPACAATALSPAAAGWWAGRATHQQLAADLRSATRPSTGGAPIASYIRIEKCLVRENR